jgi:hypothetical protein
MNFYQLLFYPAGALKSLTISDFQTPLYNIEAIAQAKRPAFLVQRIAAL